MKNSLLKSLLLVLPIGLLAFFTFVLVDAISGNTGSPKINQNGNSKDSLISIEHGMEAFDSLVPIEFSEAYVSELTEKSKQHILWGEINKSGRGVGGHFYGAIERGTLRIRPNSKVDHLNHDIIKAFIDIRGDDGKWIQKSAKTTFFPTNWSEDDVLNAVSHAFLNKKFVGDNEFHGASGSGFDIRMHLKTDGSDEIITAFPNVR
jgi:hypothetical protein